MVNNLHVEMVQRDRISLWKIIWLLAITALIAVTYLDNMLEINQNATFIYNQAKLIRGML